MVLPVIPESAEVATPHFSLKQAFLFTLTFVSFLWLIEGLQVYFQFRLFYLGITPRTGQGFIGILSGPLVHGGYEHLLSNTLPLIVVGTGLMYFYYQIAFRVIGMIWIFTGFWVWLAARPEPHIGASGLIYGFVCFLFFSGIFRRDTRLMAISLLVTFLYGSMVWGVLPVDQSISWESHLFGALAGIFSAIYFRKEGPQKPKAQWEIDEEEEQKINIEESEAQNLPPNPPLTPGISDQPWNITYDYKESKEEPPTAEGKD